MNNLPLNGALAELARTFNHAEMSIQENALVAQSFGTCFNFNPRYPIASGILVPFNYTTMAHFLMGEPLTVNLYEKENRHIGVLTMPEMDIVHSPIMCFVAVSQAFDMLPEDGKELEEFYVSVGMLYCSEDNFSWIDRLCEINPRELGSVEYTRWKWPAIKHNIINAVGAEKTEQAIRGISPQEFVSHDRRYRCRHSNGYRV